MTATLHRRKEVLQLAEEHDILILEDDPYYYLYFGTDPRSPSYFTLERELLPAVGRVLRFDSFSKVLSAGIRIGFVTGPSALVDLIDMHVSLTTFPSLVSLMSNVDRRRQPARSWPDQCYCSFSR
jgi:tryptophan aminotransferase